MADARSRLLARAAASGDLQAEARALVERVRRGDLTQERLELAAYCGHEGARVACPEAGWSWPLLPSTFARHEQHEAFFGFANGLQRWAFAKGVPGGAAGWVLARAALAGCRAVVASLFQRNEPLGSPWVLEVLEAGEDWCDEPTSKNEDKWTIYYGCLVGEGPAVPWSFVPPFEVANPSSGHFAECVMHQRREIGDQPVREGICSALTAWALGEAR